MGTDVFPSTKICDRFSKLRILTNLIFCKLLNLSISLFIIFIERKDLQSQKYLCIIPLKFDLA